MLMLSTISGTFLHPLQLPGCDAGFSLQAGTAPTEIPWAWGRVGPTVCQCTKGKKHRLKTTWPAKEFYAVNLSTSVCWQRPRGKRSMSYSREVHTVPFRKRHFEFGTRPWYIQYPSEAVTPGKGVLKIELQMPIQHGGRERKGQDKQLTEQSHLLQLRLIPFCLLQAGALGRECSWHTWEKESQAPADLVWILSAETALPQRAGAALLTFRHICCFFKPQQVPLLYIGLWASTDLTGWDSAKDSHCIM